MAKSWFKFELERFVKDFYGIMDSWKGKYIMLFFVSQEISSCDTKNAPRDRTAAERKMSLTRLAAGGESRKRDSILLGQNERDDKTWKF